MAYLGAYQQNHLVRMPDTACVDFTDIPTKYPHAKTCYLMRSEPRLFTKERGYNDVYLIDKKGNVIYSLSKGIEFATNIKDGEWKDTQMARVFSDVTNFGSRGTVHFSDFSHYTPSNGAAASFIASPVYDGVQRFRGVLIFKITPDRINEILTQNQGLGATGELFIVGSDGLMRTDSRFSQTNDALITKFEHPAVEQALQHQNGDGLIENYRGGTFGLNAQVVEFFGTKWVLVLAQSVQEMDLPINAMRTRMVLVVLGLLGLIAFVGIRSSRALTRPIGYLVADMQRLAIGDTNVAYRAAKREDEIGDMVRAVAVFRDNEIEKQQISRQKDEADRANGERQSQVLHLQNQIIAAVAAARRGDFTCRLSDEYTDDALINLAEQFNDLLDTIAKGLVETGEVLSALACGDLTFRVEGHYEGAFGRLKDDTNALASAFESILGEIQSLIRELHQGSLEMALGANDLAERSQKQASAITQTTATVQDVVSMVSATALNAEGASKLADEAQGAAHAGGLVVADVSSAIERIRDSSSQVAQIISLINDIAFQTNLLALNASVEAARAGEAGRGFAVVAQEVRRLAQSAAEASKGIEQLVRQSEREVNHGVKLVERAAQDLTGIVGSVQNVNQLMSGIASAANEQARNLSELAVAVREVDVLAQQNGALVEQTRSTIASTERKTEQVEGLLEQFNIRRSA